MPGVRILVVILAVAGLCLLVTRPAVASLAGISADSIGQPIELIRVSGNERTQERYIRKWMAIEPGDPITIDTLNRARQALMDTGLFKQVQFQTESDEEADRALHVIVEERKFSLLLPRLSRNGDGDVKAGVRLRMYNLQGADRSLDMLVQQEEEADGDDSEQLRLRYTLPLYARPYELKWRLNQTIENTEVEDFENVETSDLFSMGVSRDWNLGKDRVPLTIETALTFEDIKLDRPYPEDLDQIEAGSYNRVRLEFSFDDIHRERYRRYGDFYSLSLERGFDWLDSDYDSNIVTLKLIRFRPLNRYDNLNYRLVFAVSNDSPFDYLRYDIGGATNLRGLESIDERGDARLFTNIEYVFAYRRHPGLRHTLFIDVGNVYDDLDAVDLGDLRYTVGTGFRWKIDSFVKTDLYLDYGYDVEESEGKLYGGTSLAF